jgi:hypothetical protein
VPVGWRGKGHPGLSEIFWWAEGSRREAASDTSAHNMITYIYNTRTVTMGQEKSDESSHFREITQTALPLLLGETFEVPNAQKPAFQFQGLLDLRVSAAPPSLAWVPNQTSGPCR